MAEVILGISAFYHDSAAALLVDGEIIAASSEEAFTRKKHDNTFPSNAVRYILAESGLTLEDIDIVAFYEKPLIKFERLLETYHAFAPAGLKSFLTSMPVWMKEKLFMKKQIRDSLSQFGKGRYRMLFPEHHLSHAASAFYPSPFEEAAILTIDGVGEWATTTISHGTGNQIHVLRELTFPHSLGLLYSAFTHYVGFRVNSGEYKLMGLAPYGDPRSTETEAFIGKIKETLIDIREDGSMLLNMAYFSFATGLRMTHDSMWTSLFGIPPRKPEATLEQSHMNLALAIQTVTEEIVTRLATTARNLTGSKNLVMAGGVALNCVANGKIQQLGIFEKIWIQPASSDAGGALGAAYCGRFIYSNQQRSVDARHDGMKGCYLGPGYTDAQIEIALKRYEAEYTHFVDDAELMKVTAELLAEGNVVAWYQGRMEFGPRALGNRSILGDSRNPEMQKKLNLKVKYRESFRPFAPSILEEDFQMFFEGTEKESPYMLFTYPVKDAKRNPLPPNYQQMTAMERLYFSRSEIPAVTHLDYSARVQTVSRESNPRFWELLQAFKKRTGCGMLVNTSFNVRGEPIVCSPEEAYVCFMRTEIDYIVLSNFLLKKSAQKPFVGSKGLPLQLD